MLVKGCLIAYLLTTRYMCSLRERDIVVMLYLPMSASSFFEVGEDEPSVFAP